MEDLMELLMLMATDDGSNRQYHNYQLLRQIANSQKTSALDTIFALLGGFVTVINFLSFYQVPASAFYVLGLSALFMVMTGYFWWTKRKESHGEETLENVFKVGIRLDELRRLSQQLMVAKQLKPSSELTKVESLVRRKLTVTVERLGALLPDMKELDYFTLGENEAEVQAEIEDARSELKPTVHT